MKHFYTKPSRKHLPFSLNPSTGFIFKAPPLVPRLLIALAVMVAIASGLLLNSTASIANEPKIKFSPPTQQSLKVSSEVRLPDVFRDGYNITSMSEDEKVAAAKAYAHSLVTDDTQWVCLSQLWNRESGWRFDAANVSSGAYGIPQALPGNKMAQMGSDWPNNWETQINWGIWYIQHASYKTPCNAWDHETTAGWY